MGGACSMRGGDDKRKWNYFEILEGTDYSEDISVGGRIILKLILGYDWIHLAEDRDPWRAL
jgi:hypothetical protein